MSEIAPLAAVDLGSNSFRLEIGRLEHGQLQRMDYLKEPVRLGSGLDQGRRLTPEAIQRGYACLARFAERLTGFAPAQVRAVATQTLREAHNRQEFLDGAQKILGFPIEVISGREEARLIYQGVAHLLPQADERRLVVDIGGRSTELILGRQLLSTATESYRLGSVSWSMRYFPQGVFTARAMRSAEVAAMAVLEDALNTYRRENWDAAYGSSGTIGAVSDLLQTNTPYGDAITPAGLDWLRDQLLAAQSADRLRMAGLKEERRAVIAGGLCVLRAVFELLEIAEMQAARGALRHGVLFEMLDGKGSGSDVRTQTLKHLSTRFEIDETQARRVARVAICLWRRLNGTDAKANTDADAQERTLLNAAALHEIGRAISHADYHKHGAYILANAEAFGFAQPELQQLSELVLGHRGKLRKVADALTETTFSRQLLCLRLAVVLCHARQEPEDAHLRIESDGAGFSIAWPLEWAARFPQSAHLLTEEALAWQKTSRPVAVVAPFAAA